MDAAYQNIYRGFTEPPASCTQIPFWFLNGTVNGKEYSRQIEEMQSKGVNQAMPHPRFGMDRRDYLTPRYWAAMKELLDRASEIGFTIHLYDEFNWSSGPAGGKVTSKVENCALGLGLRSKQVTGPATARIDGWEEGFFGWGRREDYLSTVLMPLSNHGEMDLEKSLRLPCPPSDAAVVEVEVPLGKWEAMVFYTIRTIHPSPLKMDNGGIVDYLSPGPTAEFIRFTHKEYAHRFGNYFGNVIESIFYDESAPYATGPFTWSETFVDDFVRLKGYDIIPLLPLMFHTLGDGAEKVRCDYWDVVSTLFTDNFIGQLADWCKEHDIALTGHTYEEPERWTLAADPYRTLRRQHWPGFDSLSGYRKYSESKLAASVPHVTGGEVLLCEGLGCMKDEWSTAPRTMKQIYNQLAVVGVTHMVPHAFFQTVDNPKVECPPSYFEHNLYWRYYERIAEMTARQCWMNRQGVHVADVAVLYPIVSWWGDSEGGRGKERPSGITNYPAEADTRSFENIIDELMADQLDLDVLDSKALQEASLGEGSLDIAEESYKVLVIPPMNTIRLKDVLRAADFARQGGIVVVVERWPYISMAKGRRDVELAAAVHDLKSLAHFAESPVVVPALVRDMIKADVEVLAGDRETLNLSHRRINGIDSGAAGGGAVDVYLVNHNSTETETVEVSLRTKGDVQLWDPETGKANRVTVKALDGRTVVHLTLGPYEAPYLIVGGGAGDDLPELLPYPGQNDEHVMPVDGPWQFLAVPEWLYDDNAKRPVLQEIEVPVFKTSKTDWADESSEYAWILREWYKLGFDDKEWELVHCLREPLLYSHRESRAFRAPIPIGASALKLPLPISGEYALYLNGECLRVVTEHLPDESGWLELSECDDGLGVVAVECSSMAPDFGITNPFTFLCKAKETQLQSWKELGLWWYSGYGFYRKEVEISEIGEGSVYLDLGEIKECSEVWINGKPAGVCLWPPYSVEITKLVKPGRNEVEVLVSNLLSNRYYFDSWGSRGKGEVLDSGMIGPVSIKFYP